jgi:hypothetical protein
MCTDRFATFVCIYTDLLIGANFVDKDRGVILNFYQIDTLDAFRVAFTYLNQIEKLQEITQIC